jgi:hypothetical protein
MDLKSSEELIRFFEPIYPGIRRSVANRIVTGKNLYNARTHKVKSPVRDDGEAGAILLIVESIMKETHKRPQFYKDEQRRLDRIGLDGQGPM